MRLRDSHMWALGQECERMSWYEETSIFADQLAQRTRRPPEKLRNGIGGPVLETAGD